MRAKEVFEESILWSKGALLWLICRLAEDSVARTVTNEVGARESRSDGRHS